MSSIFEELCTTWMYYFNDKRMKLRKLPCRICHFYSWKENTITEKNTKCYMHRCKCGSSFSSASIFSCMMSMWSNCAGKAKTFTVSSNVDWSFTDLCRIRATSTLSVRLIPIFCLTDSRNITSGFCSFSSSIVSPASIFLRHVLSVPVSISINFVCELVSRCISTSSQSHCFNWIRNIDRARGFRSTLWALRIR